MLQKGTRVGNYIVIQSSPDQLELRGSRRLGIGLGICGLLLAIYGVLPWLSLLRGDHLYISSRDLFIGPIGLLLAFSGVSQLASRLWIVGGEKHMIERSLFGKQPPVSSSSFDSVFAEIHPTDINQRETLVITVLPRGVSATRPLIIGGIRTNNPNALSTMRGALEIARLLTLPIIWKGECKEGKPELKLILSNLATP